MDPYSLIAQYPNAGASFSDAFNKGMQQNALAGFAMHPDDPNAQGMAARYDPGAVMQYKQTELRAHQQGAQQQTEEWHKYAGELAKWADSPEKWDQAVDYMISSGHTEAAQLKGHFSPALRQNFMALGGIQDDKPTQPHLVPFQQGGGVVAINPDGTTRMVIAPNDGQAPAGSPVNNGQPLTDDQMRQLMGGQAGSPSPAPFR